MGRTQLLDHLAGAQQEGLWESETECLCCLEIDDELEAGWLFDRKVCRFGARQDFMYQLSGVTVQVGLNAGIGHQSALISELPKRADRIAGRRVVAANSMIRCRCCTVNGSTKVKRASGGARVRAANTLWKSSGFRSSGERRVTCSAGAASSASLTRIAMPSSLAFRRAHCDDQVDLEVD